jgi:hypothetical protein
MTWEWNRTTHTIVLIILIAPWVIALGFVLWRNYRRLSASKPIRAWMFRRSSAAVATSRACRAPRVIPNEKDRI